MVKRSLFFKQTLVSSLFWWPLAAPLWSCPLPSEAVQRVFEGTPALEQRSQLPGRCDYSWARDNQEQIAASNADQLKQGAGVNQALSPLWHRLQLDLYTQAETPAQARIQFKQLISTGPTPGFGSPDPLQGLNFESLRPEAAWDKQQHALLFVKGRSIYRLHLQVPGLTPEKIREKALALSEAVNATKAP